MPLSEESGTLLSKHLQ